MHKNRYLYITLLAVLGFNTEIANAQDTIKYAPRLVVNITIDQLRSDYLEAFTPLYGKGGFKRLLNEGLVLSLHHHRPCLCHLVSLYGCLTLLS